ncbi:hypothetical protein ED733_002058 [Metarhizium rileyi]|uniref:Uncharacterized protein n=1 Tax=Metarhizium rileyi (strain RCEF 4871) TaxID=1649241 RepID=A0A5C6FZ31_METRR|nr:hypothetical protein ED733_002058 [Metarhizium rileyi]
MDHKITETEAALLERISLLQGWYRNVDEAGRTVATPPLYVRLWSKLGAKLEEHDRPVATYCISDNANRMGESVTAIDVNSDGGSLDSDSELQSGLSTPDTATTASSDSEMVYGTCFVCDGKGCPLPQPDTSKIDVPSKTELANWTAHRLQRPEAYSFNHDYAAIRSFVGLAAAKAAGGGTRGVKGASREVQLESFIKMAGSETLWARYDLMTSVWLTFTVVSAFRGSGMQPILAFQQAAMACTLPDYVGTADGEDPKYAGAALKLSAHGFDVLSRHNGKGTAGAQMIAALLTRPGYGRGADVADSGFVVDMEPKANNKVKNVDRNTWLHMRWYDGGVVPYFMCHDWSLEYRLRRLTTQQPCDLVDSCYDVTIWLNDLSDYALDRTIGEGGNSLVYALSQSGESNPGILADFCSDVVDRVCECPCGSSQHEIAADIAVGFTTKYALAFRYRGLENAWLARDVEIQGVVRRGWLIRGGSRARHEWPRVPFREDWGPLTTVVPAEVDLETAKKSWEARCGLLAVSDPGQRLISHILSRYAESTRLDEAMVSESLRQLWSVVEPVVKKLGGDTATIYKSVEILVLSLLDWPAIFAAPEPGMGQCAVRDKIILESSLMDSAAYGFWCCGTKEASDMIRFLTGLAASVVELTIVATYRRIPTLWSEDGAGWEPVEHKECTHR